jgi:voltage-gated potassium channel
MPKRQFKLFSSLRASIRRNAKLLIEARLHYTFLSIFIVMMLGGFTVWMIEGKNTFDTPFDAVWWSIVTMTTVGYGDITPQFVPGKLAAIILILTGVSIVSLFTARISSVFVATRIREEQGLQEIFYHNHLIVSGWHPGAEKLIESLLALSGSDLQLVLVNNLQPNEIDGILDHYSALKPKFVRGDLAQETILRKAGVKDAWATFLLPDMQNGALAGQIDQHTILTALSIKGVNKMVKVYAYALDPDSIPHMKRGGVDKVVVRDAHAGYLLACHALAPGIPDVIEELLTFDSGNRIERIVIPAEYVGKTVADLEVWARQVYDGLLIGLVHEEQVLELEDILSDDYSSIDAFIKRKFEEAGRHTDELAHKKIDINPDPSQTLMTSCAAVIVRRVS